jgi:hypothetical protein
LGGRAVGSGEGKELLLRRRLRRLLPLWLGLGRRAQAEHHLQHGEGVSFIQ